MSQRITLIILSVFLLSCSSNNSSSDVTESTEYDFPWYNPAIVFEDRLQLLIDEMTIEEKISQLTYDAAAIERLGVPEYNWWSEALHGVARNGRATVFPQPIGMGATFDRELIHRVFTAVSDEGRAKFAISQELGNYAQYAGLTFWTPNVNIFRDPRWGRGMETYGEDPYLTAQLGMEVVRGLQGDHPKYLKSGACAKHYAVHSGPEALRHEFDAITSMKDLHETYLPAFKALVTEVNVESVMGAYNRVLGEPACASNLLYQDILMDTWGFQGHFLSDCWAIQDFHTGHKVTGDVAESAAMALNHGVSLNCGNSFPALKEALDRGLVTEATIDQRLATLFITRFELGLFDPPSWNPYNDIDESVINCEEHEEIAYEAALKSMVLLKNNGVLPLKKDLKTLYITGPQANNSTVLLGNYYGLSNKLVNILEGITSRVSAGTTVDYRMGAQESVKNINPVDWASGGAKDHEATIVVLGISQLLEGEEGESLASPSLGDRLDLNLPANQLEYLRKLKEGHDNPVIVVMTGGSPITMPEVEELADAILWVWYPGQEGGSAVADLIFGNEVPSGKLPLTFPESVDQLPPYEEYSMKERTYRYISSKPLYPFGYGLSYTEFSFNDLHLDREEIAADESLTVSVKVKNNGDLDADEVVQLYVSVPDPDGIQPRWSLKNFTRVTLEKGSSTEVSFKLNSQTLEQFNQEGEAEVVPGEYRVYVGNGSPGKRSKELGVQVISANFHIK
ncbi:MAG: glycoside hydrolase family 3 protein [Bacteroidetes bacterium]|nr:MAG: glycoside hydrolase family 3 protein [Bacteroidota bacterium]